MAEKKIKKDKELENQIRGVADCGVSFLLLLFFCDNDTASSNAKPQVSV